MSSKSFLLFYPSSYLPHKNHKILLDNKLITFFTENNIFIALTIPASSPGFQDFPFFYLLGNISRDKCLHYMKRCDALLFLSAYESLGLPLIEASLISKPIICPYEIYTSELLGDSPYYFDSDYPVFSLISLLSSLISLPMLKPSSLVKSVSNMHDSWAEFKLRLAL